MYFYETKVDVSVGGIIYHNISVRVDYEILIPRFNDINSCVSSVKICKIEKQLSERSVDLYNNVINIEALKKEIWQKEMRGAYYT